VIKRLVDAALARRGYAIARTTDPDHARRTHPDVEDAFADAYRRCAPFTMTSVERMYALWQAVGHIARNGVRGDVVECGVWRGGSSMLATLALAQAGDHDRVLWLYDTYEGMSEPSEHDVDPSGRRVAEEWHRIRADPSNPVLAYATLDDVRANLGRTGYPTERMHFVKGKVEESIPSTAPDQIALLRLDTDWYESTRHELEHLWDRVEVNGVLIVDDYGHWAGARQAVDEFFASRADAPLLNRIDYTGRIGVRVTR
jgi:O-methyltransferase